MFVSTYVACMPDMGLHEQSTTYRKVKPTRGVQPHREVQAFIWPSLLTATTDKLALHWTGAIARWPVCCQYRYQSSCALTGTACVPHTTG